MLLPRFDNFNFLSNLNYIYKSCNGLLIKFVKNLYETILYTPADPFIVY